VKVKGTDLQPAAKLKGRRHCLGVLEMLALLASRLELVANYH
jgi:hypothetical protein